MRTARGPLRTAAAKRQASAESAIRVELPASGCCRAVGRLVVGGVASRLDFAVEQIEDLQLAVEALLSRSAARSTVTLEVEEAEQGLRARIGPLTPTRSDRDRMLRMLLTLVEDADVQDSRDGEWIVLTAARSRPSARESG
jgi:hypothetical protein